MVSSYPASNDVFTETSTPLLTPLGDAGDGTRTHSQHHRDLGDAIEALQANVAITTHDHTGTGARATNKLPQINTHESPDTDVSAASLHHTLGTTAFKASPGNHVHNGTDSALIPISSVTNLQATLDSKLDASAYTAPASSQILTYMMLSGA